MDRLHSWHERFGYEMPYKIETTKRPIERRNFCSGLKKLQIGILFLCSAIGYNYCTHTNRILFPEWSRTVIGVYKLRYLDTWLYSVSVVSRAFYIFVLRGQILAISVCKLYTNARKIQSYTRLLKLVNWLRCMVDLKESCCFKAVEIGFIRQLVDTLFPKKRYWRIHKL